MAKWDDFDDDMVMFRELIDEGDEPCLDTMPTLAYSAPLARYLPPPSLSAPHALIYAPRAFRALTHAPTRACAHARTRCDKRMRTHTNAP